MHLTSGLCMNLVSPFAPDKWKADFEKSLNALGVTETELIPDEIILGKHSISLLSCSDLLLITPMGMQRMIE